MKLKDVQTRTLLYPFSGPDFLNAWAIYPNHAEYVFLDTLWPDFDRRHLWHACEIYASRDRRYGVNHSLNYDILKSTLLQQRTSAFYNAQCCGIAAEYQRYNYSGLPSYIVPADHRFFLSFTLAGLGNFSPFHGALGAPVFAEGDGLVVDGQNISVSAIKNPGDLPWKDKKVEELSKGMQQKVQIIAAIIHDPEFIILDEPFSGLDPVNMKLVKELILHRDFCIT
mgnify:CR=1 FL=1